MIDKKTIPQIGLGCWKLPTEVVPKIVEEAIRIGYRHIDSASDYGNEKEVGDAIKKAIDAGVCTREELFVTSKLWNTHHHPQHVKLAVQKTLDDLGLDYLDLYLIHFPIAIEYVPIEERYPAGWFFDPDSNDPKMKFAKVPLAVTWRAMEALVEDGLVKQIGVCNYNTGLVRDLLSYAEIPPSVLQAERHPYLTQQKLIQLCTENQIQFTGFSPFGGSSYEEIGMATPDDRILDNHVITSLATQFNRTPAQVILRWATKNGLSVIPKTSKIERLKENLNVFDFDLTSEQLQQIDGLNKDQRYNDPGVFCHTAFNTNCPIYD